MPRQNGVVNDQLARYEVWTCEPVGRGASMEDNGDRQQEAEASRL